MTTLWSGVTAIPYRWGICSLGRLNSLSKGSLLSSARYLPPGFSKKKVEDRFSMVTPGLISVPVFHWACPVFLKHWSQQWKWGDFIDTPRNQASFVKFQKNEGICASSDRSAVGWSWIKAASLGRPLGARSLPHILHPLAPLHSLAPMQAFEFAIADCQQSL